MVAELVIWNNDLFNGEFPESRKACKIQRWNTIIPTLDAVDYDRLGVRIHDYGC